MYPGAVQEQGWARPGCDIFECIWTGSRLGQAGPGFDLESRPGWSVIFEYIGAASRDRASMVQGVIFGEKKMMFQ